VKISCKEDVHICRTNFAKQIEQNLHETTGRWNTYGNQLFTEDLEVRDVVLKASKKLSQSGDSTLKHKVSPLDSLKYKPSRLEVQAK
jgi:hypothetical protein